MAQVYQKCYKSLRPRREYAQFQGVWGICCSGTAVIFTSEEKKIEAKRCFEYLEEFRGLARLAEPHLTGSGIVSHDLTTIVGRYKVTSDSLSSRTCRSALEFLPVDSVEMKRALREARRLDLILKNLETAP